MEVLVGASKSDQGTEHLAALTRPHLNDLMNLLHESTKCLQGKRQLKGFDVESFRGRFAHALAARGFMNTA